MKHIFTLLKLTKGLEEVFGVVYYSTGVHLLNTLNTKLEGMMEEDLIIPIKYVAYMILLTIISVFALGIVTIIRYIRQRINTPNIKPPNKPVRIRTKGHAVKKNPSRTAKKPTSRTVKSQKGVKTIVPNKALSKLRKNKISITAISRSRKPK